MLVCWFLLASSPLASNAENVGPPVLRGRVVDGSNGQLLRNATVQLWDTRRGQQSTWRLVASVRSDTGGNYEVSVGDRTTLRVYAYLDYATTPGIDYVPVYQDVTLPAEKNVTLMLRPGGTVAVDGELRFVESASAPHSFTFAVVNLSSGKPSAIDPASESSTTSPSHAFLGLDDRRLVVPADTQFEIAANASILVEGMSVFRSFLLGQAEPFRLGQGEVLRIKTEIPVSRFNFDLVESALEQTELKLDDVESRGFYVTLERQEMARFKDLLSSAVEEGAKAAYDASFADLREAYIGVSKTSQRIGDMFGEATSSVLVLSAFLALTAVVISSFLLDRWPLKLLFACLFSGCFFAILFLVYPGARLVETTSLYMDAILSLSVMFLGSVAFSFLADPKVVQIFAIAKKNLRKRRTRFLLSLISVTMLAMSFVTLTSFATGYGLEINSFSASDAIGGLLARRPLTKDLPYTIKFLPMEDSTLTWLQSKPEVSSAAPKYENVPLMGNIGVLAAANNSTKRLSINGVMGIQPRATAEIPQLRSIVLQGRYLEETDRGILLSTSTAERIGVKVGDEMLWSSILSPVRVTVLGLFDDDAFGRITDLDSKPVIPQKIVLIPASPPLIMVESCDPSEVVLTTAQVAQEMSSAVVLSRIRVVLKEPDLAFSMARRVALERDLMVWSFQGGKIYSMVVGEYTEAKGLSVMVPWVIVVLNVIITMWNAVFERRREVAILSSVGLNPTHIGGLFLAEAAVIGFAGGGVGYLFGLGGYRLLSVFSVAVEVRQKVSAVWSAASLGISLAAVLVGTSVALRYSVGITPSLMRKWTMGQNIREGSGPIEFSLPFRLRENDVDVLFAHVKERVHSYVLSSYASLNPSLVEKMTKVDEKEVAEGHVKSIFFSFAFGQHDAIGAFPFGLLAEKKPDEENYALRMVCRGGNADMVNQCGTYMRMLIVDWSARKNK